MIKIKLHEEERIFIIYSVMFFIIYIAMNLAANYVVSYITYGIYGQIIFKINMAIWIISEIILFISCYIKGEDRREQEERNTLYNNVERMCRIYRTRLISLCKKHVTVERNCFNKGCFRKLVYDEYIRDNIYINYTTKGMLKDIRYYTKLWNDSRIQLYCCECYRVRQAREEEPSAFRDESLTENLEDGKLYTIVLYDAVTGEEVGRFVDIKLLKNDDD